jgi:CRISPR system Cascade subunit CasA
MVEHSLLSDAMFHVTGANGTVACLSLPQVLARLSASEDLAFDALRPHQRAPWHAFLVQLAFLALEDQGDPQPPQGAPAWAHLLRALAPGHDDDAPWCLLNADWQRPAFLQPPCSTGREGDFKRSAAAAQDIDVLVTARHHDEKTGKLPLREDALDALVYALVLLQGWSAFLGAGNYNTMRMNGGFSSRPQFRLAYQRGTGPEFMRDLRVLLDSRQALADAFISRHGEPGAQGLHRLLWLPPWDEGSLPLAAVHPLCLEVCRRVRLVREGDGLRLRRASSNAMRVAAKEMRGDVLDPWVPIVAGSDGPKALTSQAHTLGYRSLQGLLFDKTKARMPLLAGPSEQERSSNQSGTLIAQVLVSGDGGTDGLLLREILAPAPVLTQLTSAPVALAQRSQQFVSLAGLASGKVYRSALLQFIDGGAEVDWKNRDFTRAVDPWVDRFEQAVDEAFFTRLFASIDKGLDDSTAERQWVHWLAQTAAQHLQVAALALPTRDGSRRFARVRAERLLRLSLRKQFGGLLAADSSAPAGVPQDPDTEDAAHG